MKIVEYIKNNLLFLDGGMGTLLQGRGLAPGELPEYWSIMHPEIITEIHKEYYDSGSNVVNANTFGANSLKFSHEELDKIISASIKNARTAAKMSTSSAPKWVALDVGPTGKMLKPYGDLDFEDAVSIFAETVKLGEKHGADLIFIETMNDSYETKAALLAARENSELPVFVCCAYGEDGKLLTGADAVAMVAMLEGLGADAIGVNCSLGPDKLTPVVKEYLKYSSLPVILKANAGLPHSECGKTVFDITPDEFVRASCELVSLGVRAVGGCCGTTPDYIRALVGKTREIELQKIEKKTHTLISSYTHAVSFGGRPVLIGERINPTGKPKFKDALRTENVGYILNEGIAEEERGAHVLDVNVGLPGIAERDILVRVVCELQAIIDLPLQIDTSDVSAMEAALRIYNGKPMINSVNGKAESMQAVFPLAKKYGGVIVALTLDEDGIPESAEGRVAIAKKILSEAEKYGIDKKDIIFDPLAMAVSADSRAANETLRAVEIITRELGCHTSLGVSNISFGLPARDMLNSTFFSLALGRGLSAAIINPHSDEMMKVYKSYLALSDNDENFSEYISFAEELSGSTPAPDKTVKTDRKTTEKGEAGNVSELSRAVIKGMAKRAAECTREMLRTATALDIIKNDIVPALDIVGVGFEKKTVYLPGLLMSAEAAKASFEVIKNAAKADNVSKEDGKVIVIATVKGDIHDIGKNIVKLLLENYGFTVHDIGRDVPPERIVEEAIRLGASIVGLSALMTTTVPAMEETIKLLRERAPECRVMVGGAVLTEEYAKRIDADKYAKDAMEAVRYAEYILK